MPKLNEQDKEFLLSLKEQFGGGEDYFGYWKFNKVNNDANSYFNSYINSPGVQRILDNQKTWWEGRHPYKQWYSNFDQNTSQFLKNGLANNLTTYTFDGYPLQSSKFSGPKGSGLLIGNLSNLSDKWPPYNWILGHETSHGKWPYYFNGAQREALDQNTNTEKNHHDEYQKEKYADIQGLKYLMYKLGIYDARSNKNATEQHVKLLRKKYPHLRPLKQMNDKQVVFQLNNVAQNNTDHSLYTSSGGKL